MIGRAITRARSLGLACLVISFFIISCGTMTPPPTPALVPLSAITSAQDAQRALISIQDFRFQLLREVQGEIDSGKRPQSDREVFESFDAPFRDSWDNARHYADEWVRTKSRPNDFDTYYQIAYVQLGQIFIFRSRTILKIESH